MENWKCSFCGHVLELKNKFTKSGHLAKCKSYKKYKDDVLTKEYLIAEYVHAERSAIEIAQEHNLGSASAIIKLLNNYNIPTRNISESKNEREKNKRKETNINRYGIEHNFCKEHPSRKQWEQEMFEEYGINNIFQRDDIVKRITEIKYEKGYIIPREYKDDILEKYYADVWYLTNKNFNKFYNEINPENYKRGRNTYHLDHKISIMYGFVNGISPEIISHRCNLEMLYYKDNLSKSVKCSLTLDELLERIEEYDRICEN